MEPTSEGQKPDEPTKKQVAVPPASKTKGHGTIHLVDLAKQTITINVLYVDPSLPPNRIRPRTKVALSVTPATKIIVDRKDAPLATLSAVAANQLGVRFECDYLPEKANNTRPKDEPLKATATQVEADAPFVAGTFQAVNAPKNKITIIKTIEMDGAAMLGGAKIERTHEITKDAKVTIDGKSATLSELKPQMLVNLRMSAVKTETVLNIIAFGPTVEGVLKTVNAEKKTISIHFPITHLTSEAVPVAKDATVLIGREPKLVGENMVFGTEAKLSDLRAGMHVTLQMSADPDQSLVVGIRVEKTSQK